jgi:hypothetical protein
MTTPEGTMENTKKWKTSLTKGMGTLW